MKRLEEGIALFNAGRYPAALAVFESAAETGSVEAACLRAHCLFEIGRGEESEKAFRALLARDRGFTAARLGLISVLRRAGKLEAASRALDRWLERDPESALARGARSELLRARAAQARDAGEPERELSFWAELAAADPSDAEARAALEKLAPAPRPPSPARERVDSRRSKRPPAPPCAARELAELEAPPRPGETSTAAAWRARLAGRWGAARSLLKAALRGADAARLREASWMLSTLGLFEESWECARAASRRPGAGAQVWLEAAAAAERARRPEEALTAYRRALEGAKGDRELAAQAAAGAAGLLTLAGEPGKARAFEALVGRRSRTEPWALRLRGALDVLEGRFERALAPLEAAAAAHAGDQGDALAWRAHAWLGRGRPAEAERDAGRSLARGVNRRALIVRALASLELGRGAEGLAMVARYFPSRARSLAAAAGGDRLKAELTEALEELRGCCGDVLIERSAGRLAATTVENPRARMLALQAQLRFLPSERVLASLGRSAARAKSERARAYYHAHRGEVLLWLGRYEEAYAAIERAVACRHAQWPPAGLFGASVLLGREADARRWLDHARARGTPEAVLLPWRVEAEISAGRWDEAWSLLGEDAPQTLRPSSLVSMALAAGRLGRRARQKELFSALASAWRHFALCAQTEAGLGDEPLGALGPRDVDRVLEQARRLMLGNRSSWLFTFVAPDGELRVMGHYRAAGLGALMTPASPGIIATGDHPR